MSLLFILFCITASSFVFAIELYGDLSVFIKVSVLEVFGVLFKVLCAAKLFFYLHFRLKRK